MQARNIPWRPIEPLPALNGEIVSILAVVDALQAAWKDVQATASPAELEASLKRRLTRHAIETGILEKLYDVSWGVTEALVAEGLTSEVAVAEGEVSESTLLVIQDQFEALTYLVDWARGDQPLSLHFIRSLHEVIVRHQKHYEGRTQFGSTAQVPLRPGAWKETDNYIVRPDGTTLECTPPLQVEDEMHRLVTLYEQTSRAHPVLRAAWLHHRFVQIHPFADGNGRVARALTLLALQRGHYAPIVIDRLQRAEYINTLDEANGGDLRPLVRFFARLEEKALRAEMRAPLMPASTGVGAVAVARAYAARLKAREVNDHVIKSARSAALAAAMQTRLVEFLASLAEQFQDAFREFDLASVARVTWAAPPAAEAKYWRGQLVNAAHLADFYTNLADGAWWVRLHLRLRGSLLRFIAAIQKVGQGETGVLALTVYAEVLDAARDSEHVLLFRIFEHPHVPDSLTFVYTDDVVTRWPDVEALVDNALSAAISRFSEHLG